MVADITFAKVSSNAKIPTKREEDAGMDLYACVDERNPYGWTLEPHQTTMIPTGIIYACSPEWALILRERGSTGLVSMKLGAGVCDSGFRGEIFVQLYNGLNKQIVISPVEDKIREEHDVLIYPASKAIAQILVLPVPKVDITEKTPEEVRAIKSYRGEGQLGSSGK